MVYTYVAGCWISGNVECEIGDALSIRLVTGQVVIRPVREVKFTSPRLEDPSVWPL